VDLPTGRQGNRSQNISTNLKWISPLHPVESEPLPSPPPVKCAFALEKGREQQVLGGSENVRAFSS
jgi:hypothetical protein